MTRVKAKQASILSVLSGEKFFPARPVFRTAVLLGVCTLVILLAALGPSFFSSQPVEEWSGNPAYYYAQWVVLSLVPFVIGLFALAWSFFLWYRLGKYFGLERKFLYIDAVLVLGLAWAVVSGLAVIFTLIVMDAFTSIGEIAFLIAIAGLLYILGLAPFLIGVLVHVIPQKQKERPRTLLEWVQVILWIVVLAFFIIIGFFSVMTLLF